MSGKKTFNLLPDWWKFVGGTLMVLGLIATYYFIYLSIKPGWLQFRVFTVYSEYIETTTFSFIKNNQGDEVAIFCYLVGFLLFFFSKDKKQQEIDNYYKTKALVNTVLLIILLLFIVYFLVHGMPILYIVAVVIYLFPVLFLLLYLFQRIRKGK